MIVYRPCNSKFCALPWIGVLRKGYSSGAKMKMENVCYLMESWSLVHPTPWGMDQKSSNIYPNSFNTRKNCMRMTSQDMFRIPMNHWLRIGIAFAQHCWYPISIRIHVWYKVFGHKAKWQSWDLRPCSSTIETSVKNSPRTTIMLALLVIPHLHFVWLLIAMKVIWLSYVIEMRSTLNRFGWWKHRHDQILFQLAQFFAKLRWNIAIQVPKIKMYSTHI